MMEIDELEWKRSKDKQRETDDEFRERMETLCCHTYAKVLALRKRLDEYEESVKDIKRGEVGLDSIKRWLHGSIIITFLAGLLAIIRVIYNV